MHDIPCLIPERRSRNKGRYSRRRDANTCIVSSIWKAWLVNDTDRVCALKIIVDARDGDVENEFLCCNSLRSEGSCQYSAYLRVSGLSNVISPCKRFHCNIRESLNYPLRTRICRCRMALALLRFFHHKLHPSLCHVRARRFPCP